MPGHNLFSTRYILLALTGILLLTEQASAYVGPGAGLEFIGYFSGLLMWIITMFGAIMLWPFYAFLRKIRGIKDPPATENPPGDSVGGEAAAEADTAVNSFHSPVSAALEAPVLSLPEGRGDSGHSKS